MGKILYLGHKLFFPAQMCTERSTKSTAVSLSPEVEREQLGTRVVVVVEEEEEEDQKWKRNGMPPHSTVLCTQSVLTIPE